jgi:ABC-type uncharacterized transport system permease subunit
MLLWIAIITYLASGYKSISNVWGKKESPLWQLYAPAYIGIAAHTAQLISSVSIDGMLQLSLLNTISICVWLTIIVILLSALTKPLHNLFTFLMPAGALLLIIGSVTPQLAEPRMYSGGMLFHIFIALLSASIMIITTLQATLVDIQTNALHDHQINSRFIKALPPLQSMERLMFEWLMIGFFLLTIAIITGGIFIDNIFAQHLVHKTVLTIIAWAFFATLIFGHFYLGWRGQRASRLIYIGFGFLLFAFIGSKFVLEYLLKIG